MLIERPFDESGFLETGFFKDKEKRPNLKPIYEELKNSNNSMIPYTINLYNTDKDIQNAYFKKKSIPDKMRKQMGNNENFINDEEHCPWRATHYSSRPNGHVFIGFFKYQKEWHYGYLAENHETHDKEKFDLPQKYAKDYNLAISYITCKLGHHMVRRSIYSNEDKKSERIYVRCYGDSSCSRGKGDATKETKRKAKNLKPESCPFSLCLLHKNGLYSVHILNPKHNHGTDEYHPMYQLPGLKAFIINESSSSDNNQATPLAFLTKSQIENLADKFFSNYPELNWPYTCTDTLYKFTRNSERDVFKALKDLDDQYQCLYVLNHFGLSYGKWGTLRGYDFNCCVKTSDTPGLVWVGAFIDPRALLEVARKSNHWL